MKNINHINTLVDLENLMIPDNLSDTSSICSDGTIDPEYDADIEK